MLYCLGVCFQGSRKRVPGFWSATSMGSLGNIPWHLQEAAIIVIDGNQWSLVSNNKPPIFWWFILVYTTHLWKWSHKCQALSNPAIHVDFPKVRKGREDKQDARTRSLQAVYLGASENGHQGSGITQWDLNLWRVWEVKDQGSSRLLFIRNWGQILLNNQHVTETVASKSIAVYSPYIFFWHVAQFCKVQLHHHLHYFHYFGCPDCALKRRSAEAFVTQWECIALTWQQFSSAESNFSFPFSWKLGGQAYVGIRLCLWSSLIHEFGVKLEPF